MSESVNKKLKIGRYYFINPPFWMKPNANFIEITKVTDKEITYFYPYIGFDNVTYTFDRGIHFIEKLEYGQDYVESNKLFELLCEMENL